MKPSTRYVKIVEWSDEDQCYAGLGKQDVKYCLAESLREHLYAIT